MKRFDRSGGRYRVHRRGLLRCCRKWFEFALAKIAKTAKNPAFLDGEGIFDTDPDTDSDADEKFPCADDILIK